MTAVVADLGRVVEGLCPNVKHGTLARLDDGYGRCEECETDWRVENRTVFARDMEAFINMRGFKLVYEPGPGVSHDE